MKRSSRSHAHRQCLLFLVTLSTLCAPILGCSRGPELCDLVGGGGCGCLKLATIGYPGKWGDGSDVFTDWLARKALRGVDSLGGETLTPSLLSRYQVVIVQDVRFESNGRVGIGNGIGRSFTANEVSALQQWVVAGGGLATLIGYASPSEVTNVNTLLQPFALSYGTAQILGGGGVGRTAAITHWADHPVSDGIAEVGVDVGYSVQGEGTLVAWQPTQGQWDIARAADVGLGHVLAWGDDWITYNSQWTQHPEYQVQRFWLNILRWLTPPDQCSVTTSPTG